MANDIEPLAILMRARIFRHLRQTALHEVAASARIERYKKRSLLVQRGVAPEHIRYVVEGGIEFVLTTPGGREAKIPPLRPGDWAAWPACFIDQPPLHDLWSAPSSVLLAFPVGVVRSAVSDNPTALLEALALISTSLRSLMAWHLAVSSVTDEQRLGQLLFHLGERNRQEGEDKTTAHVTQEQMAQLGLGSRQRVARLMRKLEAAGLIETSYRAVSIRSLSALRTFSFL